MSSTGLAEVAGREPTVAVPRAVCGGGVAGCLAARPSALAHARSGEAFYLVDVAAGDAEGGVVAADGVLVWAFEQAVEGAVGVVVQLELAHAELVGLVAVLGMSRPVANGIRRRDAGG